MIELTMSHIDAIDGEPRVLDLTVAERLGFARPRAIRQLIERNRAELESYGPIATNCGAYHNGLFEELWLNEAQALLVCLFARTKQAAEVRHALIELFTAWRNGQLTASPQSAYLTRTQRQQINAQAWALASEDAQIVFQRHRARLIQEAYDRLPAGRPIAMILDDKNPE
jgi:hypothetical protein